MLESHPPWFYAGFIGLAAILGGAVFLAAAGRVGIPASRAALFAAACVLTGLLLGRLIVLLEQPTWAWGDLFAASFRQPGVVGGMLAGALLWRPVLLPSTSFWTLGDLGTPAVAIAFAVARVGCFVVGCCFGTTTGLPWAVRFPASSMPASFHSTMGWLTPPSPSLPVHPLQLYFLLLGVTVAALSLWLLPRRVFAGQVLLVGTALSEGGKAALESLRQPDPVHPTGHLFWMSLLVAGAAIVMLALRLRHVSTAAPREARPSPPTWSESAPP